jgi:hypothetical protein
MRTSPFLTLLAAALALTFTNSAAAASIPQKTCQEYRGVGEKYFNYLSHDDSFFGGKVWLNKQQFIATRSEIDGSASDEYNLTAGVSVAGLSIMTIQLEVTVAGISNITEYKYFSYTLKDGESCSIHLPRAAKDIPPIIYVEDSQKYEI